MLYAPRLPSGQVGLNDINTVTKICEEGCDVHFTTTVFPALTIAANRGSSDMVTAMPCDACRHEPWHTACCNMTSARGGGQHNS